MSRCPNLLATSMCMGSASTLRLSTFQIPKPRNVAMFRAFAAAVLAAALLAAMSPSANALTLCQLETRYCPFHSPHTTRPEPRIYAQLPHVPTPHPVPGFGPGNAAGRR
jgi:hypothetical protein